jgi:hypothetical protein
MRTVEQAASWPRRRDDVGLDRSKPIVGDASVGQFDAADENLMMRVTIAPIDAQAMITGLGQIVYR